MDTSVTRRRILRAVGASGLVGMGSGRVVGDPEYPSSTWAEREFRNYAKTREAPAAQATDPTFVERWQARSAANAAEYVDRQATESGWKAHGNLCATWGEQCTGDPALYPGVDEFYGEVGVRERVAFYDRGGARLSGHVWAPADARPGNAADANHEAASRGRDLPGVVLTNGSVQAPETAYWWFAQTLVRAGYVVVTYDPRGQGRSDTTTPDGEPGSNVNPSVFVTNQIDAIDFFHSTPTDPYPPNRGHLDEPAPVASYNPFHDVLDRSRLGIVGHSAGAIGASVVQGLEPWPGSLESNPVDALVAWDNLGHVAEVNPYEGGGLVDVLGGEIAPDDAVEPRVPGMGQSADYFLTPVPKTEPPDPDTKARGFERWRAADVPAYQLVIRGGTHYEWSRVPTFPATAWSFGNALADHYSLAWLDRWLKRPDEPGYHDADDRLLADKDWADRLSFYYRSARDFPDRDGTSHRDGDLRAATFETSGESDPASLAALDD